MKMGEGVTGWVAEHRSPVALSEKAATDPRFKMFPKLVEDTYQAFLSVPVMNKGGAIGVINVHHRDPHPHTAEEISTIQFNFEKATPLDDENGGYRGEPRRAAQVYVFALLKERDKSKVNPLNLDQWEFFVVPTVTLNVRKRSQQTITLHSLETEKDELKVQQVSFSELEAAVKKASSIK